MSKKELEVFCEEISQGLLFSFGLSKAAILTALAGVESSFGENNKPRFEPSYAPDGTYFKAPHLQKLYEQYGRDAACSFGPWQIMAVRALELGYHGAPSDLSDAKVSAPYVIMNLNNIFKSGAQNIEQILDAYNTGSFKLGESPKAYISKFWNFYGEVAERLLNEKENKMGIKGIKELKEMADFVLGLGVGIDASLVDGKIGFADLLNFQSVVFSALPAFQGIGQLDDEFFAMDDADKADLKAYIAEKLKLDPSHASIEGIVETVLDVVIDFKDLIAKLAGAKA